MTRDGAVSGMPCSKKNAPDMIRAATVRSHAEHIDITRGGFEGKPNVKRIGR